jgi:glycerol transport system permease protein
MTEKVAISAAGAKTSRFRLDLRSWLFWLFMAIWSLPVVWLVSMSLRDNANILAEFEVIPSNISLNGYIEFFNDPSWIGSYMNSVTYTLLNTVMSLVVALPAAYAFSRYTFSGDKHLFFWLLTNRMAPAAVFLLPFFQLYQSFDLFDTPLGVALAHMLFNVPLAVWILEGFMSGVPKQLDEIAEIDGYRFGRFFLTIFIPMIRSGIGVTAFFLFMFSWVELLIARTITSTDAKPIAAQMTRTISASGIDWALLSAAGVMTIIPGVIVIWFVRNYIAKGFALGRV